MFNIDWYHADISQNVNKFKPSGTLLRIESWETMISFLLLISLSPWLPQWWVITITPKWVQDDLTSDLSETLNFKLTTPPSLLSVSRMQLDLLDVINNISIKYGYSFVTNTVISMTIIVFKYYHIGGVMVNMLASSAVDRGFEPRLGQTKDYEIDICCFSANHTAVRESTSWHGIRIICVRVDTLTCNELTITDEIKSWLSSTYY